MSFVTTAIWNSSRRRLQSASTSAVFPDPTGPATPRRSGWEGTVRSWMGVSIRYLPSGSKEPRILRFVRRARVGEVGGRGAELLVGERQRVRDDGRDDGRGRNEDALARALAERNEAYGRARLRLGPREGEALGGGGQRHVP